ncbi:MAG: NADH-quinone oxidoreductase subunit NuoH [Deltaproteobacteria bacterium]|nr:NADH-quinone oxidoreductase subunit NuoH [Deltaproteobacteria bacterium]
MTAAILLEAALKTGAVLAFLLGLAGPLTWAERRQSAMIQDRLGPVMANVGPLRFWGLLHVMADALKMLWKEDFVPPKADKLLHALAPMIAMFPALVTFAVVPFGDTVCSGQLWEVVPKSGTCAEGIEMQIAPLNVGILWLFAIAGTGVVGAALAGYSSNNKYSLLGGLRAASQMVSYEVTMGLAIVGCLMVYGTVELPEMVRWQDAHVWGIVAQPLAFILFFTAAVAETKRVPFDLPEGESEIVGGYFTEYSGMKFGMFFTGEFIEVIVASAVLTTLFWGGWNLPFLCRDGVHLPEWAGGWHLALEHFWVTLIQIGAFIGKTVAMCWFQLMVRWTVPRFRYDQLMRLGWRYLLPVSLLNIVITGIVMLAWT